jgi:60 kDa SS-A/Ro ribonucleoprotein
MSLFNLKKKRKKTINRAGGRAYTQSPKMKLVSILLTSFAQDQYYRSGKATFSELIQLMSELDPLFVAKAGIYARTQFGMRSISHLLAAELAPYASGQPWAKDFYNKIVKRPDDMLEIVAYHLGKGEKRLPNAMKKGFSKAFDKFDTYQLAKYKGERKAVKLVDLVNLVHPVPTQRNAAALSALVEGTLRSEKTWEAKLTKAGQEAKTDAEKDQLKAAAWAELVLEGKIGYFALLRNLRNITDQVPELTSDVIRLLKDPHRIKKSMVLPFRYLTAIDALKEDNARLNRELIAACNDALEISLDNVPRFEGSTLIVLDDSGSMTWSKGKKGRSPIQIGAIFAAMLYKTNEADLMRFSDNASYLTPYHGDGVTSIAERLIKRAKSGGTNFHAIFEKATQAYDRIIILSDMQGWIGHYSPAESFRKYKQRFGADPFVYSFDLQGYGSLQFPENKVFCLAGFSDKIFDIMTLLEADRHALISEIEKIEL